MRAKVLDISRYQVNPDPKKIRAEGYVAVAIRFSVGNYYTDPSAALHWERFGDAGFLRTAYHVLTPEYNSDDQIDCFANALGVRRPEWPVVLDVELDRGQECVTIERRCRECLEIMEQLYPRLPTVYTSKSWWDKYVCANWKTPAWNGRYGLWQAEYWWDLGTVPYDVPENACPSAVPRGWARDTWDLWQWTGKGTFKDQSGFFDKDISRLSVDDFLKWASPPKPGEHQLYLPIVLN